jgi:hypothetical protein
MEVLNNKTDAEILDSLLAEMAKSSNEIRCAQQDIHKIQNRLSFALVLINDLKQKALDR